MKTITTQRAQQICADWHGGQWSALYQFASSGVYLLKNHLRYLRELQSCREPEYYLHPGTISKKHDNELKSAQRYFERAGLSQETPVQNTWLRHSIYGYLMPISNDVRVEQINYPA